jgi:hypothetical protein
MDSCQFALVSLLSLKARCPLGRAIREWNCGAGRRFGANCSKRRWRKQADQAVVLLTPGKSVVPNANGCSTCTRPGGDVCAVRSLMRHRTEQALDAFFFEGF